MAEGNIEKGDQVSWQWSGGRPGGEVSDVVKEGEAKVQSHRGNTIKKNAEPENPAVKVSRSGNDVVKKASELEIEEKNDDGLDGGKEGRNGVADDKGTKGPKQPATGEKRKAGDPDTSAKAVQDKDDGDVKRSDNHKNGEHVEKKQKNAATGDEQKKPKGRPGRPPKVANGVGGEKKAPAKKREPKKAATESGEPRRSSRNKS